MKVDRPLLGLDLAALFVNLGLDDAAAPLLILVLIVVALLPHELHEFRLNCLGALHQVQRVIVPHSQQTLRGNECGKLVFPRPRKIFDCGKDLDSQAVHKWHVQGIGRPLKKGLDDARVDGHGTLRTESVT